MLLKIILFKPIYFKLRKEILLELFEFIDD